MHVRQALYLCSFAMFSLFDLSLRIILYDILCILYLMNQSL